MDKILVQKILGNPNSIILQDQVFNLIEILETFRSSFIRKKEISSEDKISSIRRLEQIKGLLLDVKRDVENIQGYTNSRAYLQKYIEVLVINIDLIIESINTENEKDFILYTNILMDLGLKY